MIARERVDPALLPDAEQRALLQDAVRRCLADAWPPGPAVEAAADPARVAEAWRTLARLGVAALGGGGPEEGGLAELALVAGELGRAALPAPLPGTALVRLLAASGGLDAHAALLGSVDVGEARVGCAFEGVPALADGAPVSATLAAVDAAAACTHLLLVADGALGLVALDGDRARAVPTRALGADGWGEVRLAGAPVALLARGPTDDVRRVARLLFAARAHGAAERAFAVAVAHAAERRQFGQPIGRFQAVQHKLADVRIALEGTRLALQAAALAFDRGDPAWRHAASAAAAFAGPALRRAAMETQHVLGAIGYAEEHEAPRHWKRVHLDALQAGGATAARADLAAALLDRPDGRIPEADLGAAGNAFRETVRAWLAEHWTGERKAAYDAQPYHAREFDAGFARALGAEGWLSLAWPAEEGGGARSPTEQLAFLEVLERAEAPPRFGASVQANAFLRYGTPEQRARWLPEIARGEAMHGMGYSEPEAGSDLASLKTRAVRDGDAWVITGQKIWTTTWWGRYMFLAARTDPEAVPAHAGISLFVVPMDAEGITVRPATTMYDGTFANVFYDGVRVPADALVGPVNGGWKVLTDALAHERGLVGGGIVLKVVHAFDLLCADLRAGLGTAGAADPLVRDRIGALAAEIEVGRGFMARCAELAERSADGATPPDVAAMSKVFSGELMERFGEAALDLLGPRAALSQFAPGALRDGRYEQGLRHSLMWVISIGTNEIQRSLIAQRGLGLPR